MLRGSDLPLYYMDDREPNPARHVVLAITDGVKWLGCTAFEWWFAWQEPQDLESYVAWFEFGTRIEWGRWIESGPGIII